MIFVNEWFIIIYNHTMREKWRKKRMRRLKRKRRQNRKKWFLYPDDQYLHPLSNFLVIVTYRTISSIWLVPSKTLQYSQHNYCNLCLSIRMRFPLLSISSLDNKTRVFIPFFFFIGNKILKSKPIISFY